MPASQAYVPLVFAPGEAYQFDWSHEQVVLSGKTARVKAAHMRLCYSRMFLVQIYPRESQETVFDAHERAFRHGLGLGTKTVSDNRACVFAVPEATRKALRRRDIFVAASVRFADLRAGRSTR